MEEVINIRSVFTPRPGCLFVRSDYSQLEVRIVAHYSEDPVLMEALLQGGDIHSVVAKQVFKLDCDVKDVKKLYKPLRSAAKAIVFGLNYGITQYGLSKNLRITEAEAQSMIDAFYATYPTLHKFMQETQRYTAEHKMVSTLMGRHRRFTDTTPRALRQAMNFPIQSTAAEVTKDAMIAIHENIKTYFPNEAWMLMQIHDEILVETKIPHVQNMIAMMKYCMERALQRFGVEFKVPLVTDPGIDYAWGFDIAEAKSDEREKLFAMKAGFDSGDVEKANAACRDYYRMYFREVPASLPIPDVYTTLPGNVVATVPGESDIMLTKGELEYMAALFKADPDYAVYSSKFLS